MPPLCQVFRRKVVEHDFYSTAEQVGGVVLLNSPSNSSWEYEEYLRLLRLKRYNNSTNTLNNNNNNNNNNNKMGEGVCYFICADGAYARLRNYVLTQHQNKLHLRLFLAFPLCDAVIGDMDSTSLHSLTDGTTRVHPTTPSMGYNTMEDISQEVLSEIWEKSHTSMAQFSSIMAGLKENTLNEWEKIQEQYKTQLSSLIPLRLHVRCQMTTDFQKSLLLITKLRDQYPDEATLIPPPILHTDTGLQLLETGGNIIKCSRDEGSDNNLDRELSLCAEASVAETILLPTYIGIGALGGRLDHEMGAISVIISQSNNAHVVITNSTNTIFACQPNGFTQIVWKPQYEDLMCGIINFGRMKECETSGLLWNLVVGRGKKSDTQDLVIEFGKLLPVCNEVRHEVITIDLRRLLSKHNKETLIEETKTAVNEEIDDEIENDLNPPTIFSIQRRNEGEESLK